MLQARKNVITERVEYLCVSINSLSAVSIVARGLFGIIHGLVWQSCGMRGENSLLDKNIKCSTVVNDSL